MSDCTTKPDNYIEDIINAGETFAWNLQWTQPDGTAVNMTGYSVRGMLKRFVTDTSAALDLAPFLTITTPASGIVDLSIPAATTSTLSGVYVFDIETQSPGGQVTRLIQGKLTVSPEVTK